LLASQKSWYCGRHCCRSVTTSWSS